MAGGNIEAIRDWSNKYFYTKDQVSDFFTKLNTGLIAYKLTIYGSKNSNIQITEDAISNPQTYNIKIPNDGIYTSLFFFHDASTLTFTNLSTFETTTQVLSSGVYEYLIQLSPYIIISPKMISRTSPSGYVIWSYWADTPGGGRTNTDSHAWEAFDQDSSTDIGRNWTTGSYIELEFPSPVEVLKVKVNGSTKGSSYIANSTYKILATISESVEESAYVDLGTLTMADNTGEKIIDNPSYYTRYRMKLLDSGWPYGPSEIIFYSI